MLGGHLVARVDVGMEPARETAVRPLELGVGGVLTHAEHYVEVHRSYLLVVHHFGVDDVARTARRSRALRAARRPGATRPSAARRGSRLLVERFGRLVLRLR